MYMRRQRVRVFMCKAKRRIRQANAVMRTGGRNVQSAECTQANAEHAKQYASAKSAIPPASQRQTCKATRKHQASNTARNPTPNMRNNTQTPSPQYRPQAPHINLSPNNPSAHIRPYPKRTMLSIAPSRLRALPKAQRPHRSSRHGRCMSTYRMAVVKARSLTAIQARRSLAQSPRPWP